MELNPELRKKKFDIAKALLNEMGLPGVLPPLESRAEALQQVSRTRSTSHDKSDKHDEGHFKSSKKGDRGTVLPPVTDDKSAHYQRTLKLISNPVDVKLYSMDIERKITTKFNFTRVIPELKLQLQRKSNLKHMALMLRDAMKVSSFYNILLIILISILQRSLFGCEVNIALCVDASATVMEFVTDGDYVRKAIRGKSTCYECLDQKDVVLQVVSKKKSAEDVAVGPITFQTSQLQSVKIITEHFSISLLEKRSYMFH